MKWPCWVVILVAMLALLTSAPSSRAALVSVDLSEPGDGLLTLDTATSLEWLDLTVTIGFTYNRVAAGDGGFTSQGFRHATPSEVDAVLLQFGLQDNATGPFDAGRAFQNLFGCTSGCTTGMKSSQGLAESVILHPVNKTGWLVFTDVTGVPPFTSVGVSNVGADTPFPQFLVRSRVPEPSSCVLAALLFAALGPIRISRRG